MGEIVGPTFVVMATATVMGAVVCGDPVDGVAGETSTRRAVLCWGGSGAGSGFGAGLSPCSSSFRSSRICRSPLMVAMLWPVSSLFPVRILKFRYVWNSWDRSPNVWRRHSRNWSSALLCAASR